MSKLTEDMIFAAAKALSDRTSTYTGEDPDEHWFFYCQRHYEDAEAMLLAALKEQEDTSDE